MIEYTHTHTHSRSEQPRQWRMRTGKTHVHETLYAFVSRLHSILLPDQFAVRGSTGRSLFLVDSARLHTTTTEKFNREREPCVNSNDGKQHRKFHIDLNESQKFAQPIDLRSDW